MCHYQKLILTHIARVCASSSSVSDGAVWSKCQCIKSSHGVAVLPSQSRPSLQSLLRHDFVDRSTAAMTKVHPNAASADPVRSESESSGGSGGKQGEAVVFTVWRKSLLFNGNGFTVFDATGNLVFRVENYSSGSRNEIVLMDAGGKPLLTIRRKVWKGFPICKCGFHLN